MDKKEKKTSITSDIFEEALVHGEDTAGAEYGEDHDNRKVHHEKRQSSRPHHCKGPECEDVFKDK
jgi:hypothetical protein